MKKICLALLLTVAWTRGASADPVPFNGELKVILWKSLPTAPGQEDQAKNMILDLEAENGNWKRVYALAQSYNNATHEGCVTSSAITGTEFKLRIDMAIGNDQWVKGGHAGYDVVFHRDDKGELTGTFNGGGKKGEGIDPGIRRITRQHPSCFHQELQIWLP